MVIIFPLAATNLLVEKLLPHQFLQIVCLHTILPFSLEYKGSYVSPHYKMCISALLKLIWQKLRNKLAELGTSGGHATVTTEAWDTLALAGQ